MNITDTQLLKSVDYIATSPFVHKTINKSNLNEFDIADRIYKSSAMLGSIKKEHIDSLDILQKASNDYDHFASVVFENMKEIKEEQEKIIDEAHKKYESTPKVDHEYIRKCKKEIENLQTEKRLSEESIKKIVIDKNQLDFNKTRNILIVSIIGLLFAIIIFFSSQSVSALALCIGAFLGLISSIGTLFSIIVYFPLKKMLKNPDFSFIEGKIAEVNRKYNYKIDCVEKEMEKGFDSNSEFNLRLLLAQQEFYQTISKARDTISNLILYKDILSDRFNGGIAILKKTLENFDSINLWAANIVRDYTQAQHNEKIAEIEQRKLSEQEKANKVQAEAYKKQTDELRRQNALLQRQAEAADKQAREAEEIRRRMENERYGDYYKTL